ncbi:MAG: 50S ribosomal protein L29 [Proteobacteria bacterium]|nr:50S ribosomal protein L29 [Pseudomonadota bacterium]
MRAADFRKMSDAELAGKADEIRGEIAKVNMQRYSRRLEKTALPGTLRRDLARVLTVLNERVGETGGQGNA